MSNVDDILQRIGRALPLQAQPWQQPLGASAWPQAAVLVALTEESRPQVLLGRRAMHLNFHPGEVAFAGGKRALSDASPWHTAKREALEEVGLPAGVVAPIGELEPLITRTGFEVYPCIASIPPAQELIVDTGEFDSVFFSPLSVFADRNLFHLETLSDERGVRRVPHYQIGSDNVWGVTAAILVLLANIAYDAGLELQRDWKRPP